MFVSVVIPTYNRANQLRFSLQSALGQVGAEFEVLVVDDGGNDDSAELVSQLGDPRVRYIYQPHQGVSAARNLGIRKSTANWVAFLDSDDRWFPDKLRRQVAALGSDPRYLFCHTDEVWIRRGRRVNPKKIHEKSGGWIFPACLPMCRISPSSVLLHKSVLEKVGVFDLDYPVCEDYELWLRICSQYPVLFLKDPLVIKIGGHPDQLSQSRWGLDRYRLRALLSVMESGTLSYQLRVWTAREIGIKARILEAGFRKRRKKSQADQYREIADFWDAVVWNMESASFGNA